MQENSLHTTMRCLCCLLAAVLLSCCKGDELADGPKEVPTVLARYSFALPKTIVGKRSTPTRMGRDVVQEGATSDAFRGIDDINLLCYDGEPTMFSQTLGSVIELSSKKSAELDETAGEDYSATQEIRIPVGTNHFAFYANAGNDKSATHEDRMRYGVIERVGVGKNDYVGNSQIRFRPVPICTSSEPLGGSTVGPRLVALLNDLVRTKTADAAPNDRWSTVNNLYLNEAYQQLTALKTLSSHNVQAMLGYINKVIKEESVDGQGTALADAISAKILSYCEEQPDGAAPDALTLKEAYQGFPDDIHLPAGVARIKWSVPEGATDGGFVVPKPDEFVYGEKQDRQFTIPQLGDFCYPMNLQYQIFSDIKASDELIDLAKVAEEIAKIPDGTGEGQEQEPDGQQQDGQEQDSQTSAAKTWGQLLDEAYKDEATTSQQVKETTQSVVMVKQVEYAVGRLALRARISTGTLYDAKGRAVNVANGFTLKGYIVGGQREVDYNFQTVEDSRVYAIYDTALASADDPTKPLAQHLRQGSGEGYWTETDYILGLGTPRDERIYLAMELVNDCDDFWGADGLIVHGATFYLVAALNPKEGTNYSTDIDQIFKKDTYTRVDLSVMNGWRDKDGDGVPDPDTDSSTGRPKALSGLATATYGMPSMLVPHPTVGLSVNLSWGEGLYFDEVPL